MALIEKRLGAKLAENIEIMERMYKRHMDEYNIRIASLE